jgi:hypothetical protein
MRKSFIEYDYYLTNLFICSNCYKKDLPLKLEMMDIEYGRGYICKKLLYNEKST